jgi:hypothetical protein
MKDEKKVETKENFCPPCLAAVPLAFGAGGTAVSGGISNPKVKNALFWGSLSVVVVSIGVIVYFKLIKKCSTCK